MRKYVLVICVLLMATSCENHLVNNAIDHISRTWIVTKYENDLIDETITFTTKYVDYSITFDVNQDYTENYIFLGSPVSITGIYIFSMEAGILTLSDEFQSRVYDIITLTDTEMTLLDLNSDTSETYYFIPQ